jgi:hypothetical protein
VKSTIIQTLRRFALQLPDTEEGVACEGTSLESRTVKRKNKAFLFLRATEVRLKLDTSLTEAAALAKQEPARYQVGAHGWVLVKLDGAAEPVELLKRWIEESYALFGSSKPAAPRAKKKKPGPS